LAVFINIEMTMLTPMTIQGLDHTPAAPAFREGQGYPA
jgi:hypothetical protein